MCLDRWNLIRCNHWLSHELIITKLNAYGFSHSVLKLMRHLSKKSKELKSTDLIVIGRKYVQGYPGDLHLVRFYLTPSLKVCFLLCKMLILQVKLTTTQFMAQMTIFMASYFPCKNLLKNLLTLSVPEKLIFEMPIIPQNLNINSSRITKAKSINLHTIRKLIEYSLKSVPIKAMFTPTVFDILMSEGRSVFSPVQRGTGSERVK